MYRLANSRGTLSLVLTKGASGVRHTLLAAISEPDFITVAAFCVIGLLAMLDVMLRFPDLGGLIQQYNQF